MKLSIMLLGLSLCSVSGYCVIYDVDNRTDLYVHPSDSVTRQVARSVALVTRKEGLEPLPSGKFLLKTTTFERYQMGIEEPLCKSERFQRQPIPVVPAGTGFLIGNPLVGNVASGFLVDSDLFVTAGHVIETAEKCEKMAIVFDYSYEDSVSMKLPKLYAPDEVYYCSEVIGAVNTDLLDYSLIRLNRKVRGRMPLRLVPELTTDRIEMVGHPLGLPAKVSSNGLVIKGGTSDFFRAKLDTFAGNSGSPVYDPKTGNVFGILVAAEPTDITLFGEWPEGCWYSKVYCDNKATSLVPCDDDQYHGAQITRAGFILSLLEKLKPTP